MAFEAQHLFLAGVVLVKAPKFGDERGYFMETYRASSFAELGIRADFVQDNQARSAQRGTVRALHFQAPPHAQAKLVRALKGAVFDVAVDLRSDSATFGRWVGATLTAEGGEQLFVPRGFAHGYCTLADDAEVAYRCDNYYAPDAEGGLYFADAAIGIEWPVAEGDAVLSDKDRAWPAFRDFVTPFTSGPIHD